MDTLRPIRNTPLAETAGTTSGAAAAAAPGTPAGQAGLASAAPAAVVPSPTPAATVRPRSGRRPYLFLAVLAAVALGAIGIYRAVTTGRESTDDAQITADLVPIGARVMGMVTHVRVRENQPVKKGDVLVELDSADYAARVQQAEAELGTAVAQSQAAEAQVTIAEATSKGGFASARAALTGSASGVSSADAQLAAAQATLARAEAEGRKAELDLARAEQLHQANAAPQERLDTARSAVDTTRAGLARAKAEVALAEDARNTAKSRVGEARGRLSQSAPIAPVIAAARAGAELARARVRGAEAALTLARLQLGYTRIISPADGVASKLMVHEGQLASLGQPLLELVPSTTYVIANFKETQIGEMRPGQPADIQVDAFPGRTFVGVVESLSGGTGGSFSLLPADNATGNFVKVVQRVPVRVAWTRSVGDVPMRAGLSADVTVHVDK
jgi:membrane fusion protein (multidrug efflux system)